LLEQSELSKYLARRVNPKRSDTFARENNSPPPLPDAMLESNAQSEPTSPLHVLLANSDTGTIVGIIGSIVLLLGVFTPIVSVPIMGSMNYFQGDGKFVLVLAIISFVSLLTKKYQWLWLSGIGSLAIMVFTFLNFQLKMSDVKNSITSDLADNPFRGLADLAIQAVQLQWGWAVLAIGVGLIIVSAAMKEKPKPKKLAVLSVFFALIVGGALAATHYYETAKQTKELAERKEKEAKEFAAKKENEVKELAARQEAEKNQALEEIKELMAKQEAVNNAKFNLSRFVVERSRFYKYKERYREKPAIELTVRNGTDQAVARAYFKGTISSPGRSVPWLVEEFNYSIKGGLEPGEKANWRLAPNQFGEWGQVDAPSDAIFTVDVVRLDGADEKAIFDASGLTEYEQRRLIELKSEFAQ
jgi:Ca2+/Na+ antiporter